MQRPAPTRQQSGAELSSSHELFLGTRKEAVSVRSGTVRAWLRQLEGYPDNERLLAIARSISENEALEGSLLKTVESTPLSLNSLDAAEHMIEFFREHPSWWSQNVEALFEKLADEGHKNRRGIDRLKFDVEVGSAKAVYKCGKDIASGVWDILRFGYYLLTDANTRTATLKIMEKSLSLYFTLRFGSAEAKSRALKDIHEFAQSLINEMAAHVTKKWDEAKANGTEARLISEWTVRGVLEIALALYSAVKGAQALSASAKTVEVVATAGKVPKYIDGPVILKRFRGQKPTMIMRNASHKPAVAAKASPINKQLAKGLLAGLKELEKEGIDVSRVMKQQEEAFRKAYREYVRINGMSPRDRMHLYRFRKGGSLFVTEKSFKEYMVGQLKVGYSDNSQYVTSRASADRLVKRAGNSAEAYAKGLGFKPRWFRGNKVVRVDFEFRFEYHPRMPTGKEMGANEFFTGTGFTSGGMPEAVFDQVPVMDIRKVTSLGELQ